MHITFLILSFVFLKLLIVGVAFFLATLYNSIIYSYYIDESSGVCFISHIIQKILSNCV